MNDTYALAGSGPVNPEGRPAIVIHNHLPKPSFLGKWFFRFVLLMSILINVVALAALALTLPSTPTQEHKSGPITATNKIAVIKVNGMITKGTIAAPKKEIEAAQEDNDIKALVLAIDTPGGTLGGSDELYHAILKYKEKTKRPVVVSMQGMATSGGYYVAMPADMIYAERSCPTGSIGVIMSLVQFEELFKKMGVTPEVVKSGPMKDSGSPYRKMSDDERKEWQKVIDAYYRQFLDVVLAHRKDKIGGEEKLKKIADGRIYLAPEAKSLGLVDAIGFEADAIEEAKKRAGLMGDVAVISYSRPISGWLSMLIESRSRTRPLGGFDADWLAELQTPQVLLTPQALFGVKNR